MTFALSSASDLVCENVKLMLTVIYFVFKKAAKQKASADREKEIAEEIAKGGPDRRLIEQQQMTDKLSLQNLSIRPVLNSPASFPSFLPSSSRPLPFFFPLSPLSLTHPLPSPHPSSLHLLLIILVLADSSRWKLHVCGCGRSAQSR